MYEIDYDDHMESFDWELTAEEEFFFRNMMNRYCNTRKSDIGEIADETNRIYVKAIVIRRKTSQKS